MGNAAALDLITIGRCSVDLYGEQVGGRLEDMGSFAKYIGGCPANIAVGSARLGLKAGFLSRVGDEHMGRFVREILVDEGVDTSRLKTDPDRLTALVILGIRDQDTFPLIFYRENCADMAICEEDIDPHYIASAKAVVVTGTHFTTPGVEAASRKAARLAREAGRKVVFDVDYRPVLWGLTGHGLGEERFVENADVSKHLQTILPLCDLIVGTEEELHIAGGTTDTLAAIRKVRELSEATIVCKRGPMGCVVFPGVIPDSLEDGIKGPGFPVEVYNVLGAGDAFMSGFLRGWLRDEPLETCCKYANACGAFAVSRHGCAPAVPSWTELTCYLANGSDHHALREDPDLNRIHWSTTRRRHYNKLCIFAFDHRSQFEELAKDCGTDIARVGAFKTLALDAARKVAAGREGFGVLIDDRLGRDALHAAADGDLWVGRPIELPGSRPLTFEEGPDLGGALAEWPLTNCVKCLVFYHPDDPEDLRLAQEKEVVRLFDACRRTGHELLLEIIASRHGPIDEGTLARAITRFYDLGVAPDWWKLEPLTEDAAWRAVCDTIEARDPHCRGILLLGLERPLEDLNAAFVLAARHALVKGFAVGRSIFAEPARAWLKGEIDDAEATDQMARRFTELISGWEQAAAVKAA
ncbi:bifunctional 5-dehydro-2-deoxygluconokinase/5-dehydro-2-deoxyphosphogluconate aldolase [Pelagibius sp.]|uniref:bifunctional 5-dehydro-2-deoxygluconokinase/5-dehydro-2- deoxyphosphogluconate aldolase n=1 Tax=Pelagibius sp. TaxID=1931238 RepID=UPI003BB21E5B